MPCPAAYLRANRLERLANGHADGARLVGRESESCATTPFPVEREQRLLVGDVVDVDDRRESALEVHARAEVEQVVRGQFQIDRGCRVRRGALEGQAVNEGARIVFLVRGLGEAAAHVLQRGREVGFASGQAEVVVEAGGRRKLWHRCAAVSLSNAADYPTK